MTKPLLLFVDDRWKRIHDAQVRYSARYEVHIAPNVQEALRLLAENNYSVVSLDHDLNGNDYQDPDEPTSGMAIVRYLEKTDWPMWKNKPYFWIHSSNPFAGQAMQKRLAKLGYYVKYERFGHGKGPMEEGEIPAETGGTNERST